MSVNVTAICDGTLVARDNLTVSLLEDGGPRSRVAGAELISKLDAGCADI
jgi:hypothetical protein